MDFSFLASANSITKQLLTQSTLDRISADSKVLDDSARRKFGEEFEQAYDSMMATKAVSGNMKQSYEAAHQDDFREHASRLSYSINNHVIDMLSLKLSDDMNNQINIAMENATKDFTQSL